ncbi:MAG: hypothetical protein R3C53_08540 [Pirellulaceae bacterium]
MVERFEIGRGLTIPIAGEPDQQIDSKEVSRVGIVADDYIGMRPTLLVSEGDRVELGQPVFSDKKTDGVLFTAPASGTVAAIHRAEKRRFVSLIIDRDGDQVGREFKSYEAGQLSTLDRAVVVEQLLSSGLWTSLRARPFSKVAVPHGPAPAAIFVNAMDTNPLAAAPNPIIDDRAEEFKAGLGVVARLTEGPVFLCRMPGSSVPGEMVSNVRVAEFDGPHPAGLDWDPYALSASCHGG